MCDQPDEDSILAAIQELRARGHNIISEIDPETGEERFLLVEPGSAVQ